MYLLTWTTWQHILLPTTLNLFRWICGRHTFYPRAAYNHYPAASSWRSWTWVGGEFFYTLYVVCNSNSFLIQSAWGYSGRQSLSTALQLPQAEKAVLVCSARHNGTWSHTHRNIGQKSRTIRFDGYTEYNTWTCLWVGLLFYTPFYNIITKLCFIPCSILVHCQKLKLLDLSFCDNIMERDVWTISVFPDFPD